MSIHPATLKSAKYAMLLSDVLLLLETVPPENTSSAQDRERCFGGGNVFQTSVVSATDKGVRKGSEAKSKKQLKGIDVCFRLIACFDLNGGRVRLKPAQNSFVLTDKTQASVEIAVTAAQKLEWVTGWSKVECMEHSHRLELPSNRISSGAGSTGADVGDRASLSLGGDLGAASPRKTPRSTDASPRSSPSGSPRTAGAEEEDVDEIEALMALGMYARVVLCCFLFIFVLGTIRPC